MALSYQRVTSLSTEQQGSAPVSARGRVSVRTPIARATEIRTRTVFGRSRERRCRPGPMRPSRQPARCRRRPSTTLCRWAPGSLMLIIERDERDRACSQMDGATTSANTTWPLGTAANSYCTERLHPPPAGSDPRPAPSATERWKPSGRRRSSRPAPTRTCAGTDGTHGVAADQPTRGGDQGGEVSTEVEHRGDAEQCGSGDEPTMDGRLDRHPQPALPDSSDSARAIASCSVPGP